MSLNWALQAFELSSFPPTSQCHKLPFPGACQVAQGASVTHSSTAQQTHLKLAPAYGEINPSSALVHSPALQAHTSVLQGLQGQNPDPCPPLSTVPKRLMRCVCLDHWAISGSALWTFCVVNLTPKLHLVLEDFCSFFGASIFLGL